MIHWKRTILLFGLVAWLMTQGIAATAQEVAKDPLDGWKYTPTKGWGATIRKQMHSANAWTEDSVEKVLAFYKEKMEEARKMTRDLQAMESSSGSSNYTHAAGEPTRTFAWVLLRRAEGTVWVHISRSSAEKVTHISLVVDNR